MNSLRATLTFTLVALLTPGLASLARAQNQCSMAGTTGAWAFTYSGSILLPNGAAVLVASVGRFHQKDGALAGTETRSLAGQSAHETLTGTYTVNANCTAIYKFDIFESGTLVRRSTVNVIFDDDQQAVRGIFSSASLADGTPLATVITVDGRKIF